MAALTHSIGLISDTHGLLRPAACEWLRGCDLIVHAGDIGSAAILEGLRQIAPVTAVRGNNDNAAWAQHLPEVARVECGTLLICVVHDLATLAPDPRAAGIDVVIHGHSHRPQQQRRGGVLFLNPGSAGPRRFRLPISLARLNVGAGELRCEFVELEP
jgi:hypothetical protein